MKRTFGAALLIVWAILTVGLAQQNPTPPSDQSPELEEARKLHNQAAALFREKKYDEALPLAKRALQLRERVPGIDKELIANAMNVVGHIYKAKTQYDQAEDLYEKALKLLEERWGLNSKKLIPTIEDLAVTRFGLSNNSGAEKLYFRSLRIKEAEYGAEHIETSRTLVVIGVLYDRTDNRGKAVEYYKRALSIKEKTLSDTDPEVADLLFRCGCALIEDKREDESKVYLSRAEKNLAPTERKGSVLQGAAIQRWEPIYPQDARAARARGPVVVEVTVNECGRVIAARAITGNALLKPAAEDAARRWRFTPTRLENIPVKVIGTITFIFNL